MTRCLDTNVVIAVVNGRPAAAREWLVRELAAGSMFGISAIVLFEMVYGYEKSDRRAKSKAALDAFLGLGVEPWAFDRLDAEHAGEIKAVLERAGAPIGHYDLLIAAQSRRRGAILVTANTREFARVPGLSVQDWAE